MSSTALVLIDIQNDYFTGGRCPVDKMQEISVNAARLLEHARNKGQAIIHIRHQNRSDEAPFFRPGTTGAQIHECVAPKDGEPVIVKHRPNSFLNTSLGDELKAKGIRNLVICGAMSQMCIDATARAAADFGYAVIVIQDACGAKEQHFNGHNIPASQVHAAFMAPLASSYARVISTDTYLTDPES